MYIAGSKVGAYVCEQQRLIEIVFGCLPRDFRETPACTRHILEDE
jgi:hypothetical protein